MIPEARYDRLFPKIASPRPDPRGWVGGEADVLVRAEADGYVYGLEDFDPEGEHLMEEKYGNGFDDPWPELRAAYKRGFKRGKAEARRHAKGR